MHEWSASILLGSMVYSLWGMIGDSQSLPRLVGVALVVLVGLDKTLQ